MTTIRFDVHAEQAGKARNISQDLDVEVVNRDDVMPALHEAMCGWLTFAAPGLAGQDLTLWQEHADPCSGYFEINEGRNGRGTWTETPNPDDGQE